MREPRLDALRRAREPGRADPAARPRGRLRAHGLREPRPLPPGASRSWPSRRGEAQVGGGARARSRRARAAHEQRPEEPRGARRLPPDRQGRPRARSARRLSAAAARSACGAPCSATRRSPTWARSRSSDAAAPSPPAVLAARAQGASPTLQVLVGAARAAAGERARHRPRAAAGRGAGASRAACRASTCEAACPETPRRWWWSPRSSTAWRASSDAGRAPRGAGARQPRPARPLRDPRRLPRLAHRDAPGGRADPRSRGRGRSRSSTGRHGRRGRFYLFHRRGAATRARAAGWAGSASAARSRSSSGCCGAPPTPASTSCAATSRVLPRVRYLITLDRDTRLPRDVARALLGHRGAPAEPRPLRSRRGPRHRGLRHPAAARQRHLRERRGLALRAALRGPHRRRPLHDRGLGHLPGPVRRGHLHRQGPDRRRRVPRGARRAACPRTRSSRTTSSRACTRAPRSSTDVEVVDDYPASVLAHARRQHRWVRGDWQILVWLLPLGADARRASSATACR